MKLVWTEGLFVTPQHLQFSEELLRKEQWASVRALLPWAWGVFNVEFDQAAILGGQVRLLQFTGVLPDGTLIDAPGVDPLPPTVELVRSTSARGQSVYLCLFELRARQSNLRSSGGDGQARYTPDEIEVFDTMGSARPVAITVARHTLSLLVTESTPPDGVVAVKLAEVHRTQKAEPTFDLEYVPAALRLAAAPALLDLLQNLKVALVSRRTFLIERVRAGDDGGLNMSAIRVLLFLHSLNQAVARLDHCLADTSLPPERAYDVLCEIAGGLGTLQQDWVSPPLPAFVHDDLRGCFGELVSTIRKLLEPVIPIAFARVPVEPRGPGRWQAAIQAELDLVAGRLYVVLDTAFPSKEEMEAAARTIKIASPKDIERVVANALPGLGLVPVPIPPPGAPVRPGTSFFLVPPKGMFWPEIVNGRAFGVHVPGALARASIEVIHLASGAER